MTRADLEKVANDLSDELRGMQETADPYGATPGLRYPATQSVEHLASVIAHVSTAASLMSIAESPEVIRAHLTSD